MNIKHALNCRSDFSLGESMLQIKRLCEAAKAAGYESVALTDTMTISGMVEFTNQAKKAGLKPIIGCTLRVYDDESFDKELREKKNREIRLKAYVQTEEGLKNLIAALSKAYNEDQFYYNARMRWDDVKGLQGCVLTTGDFFSLFHHPDHLTKIAELQAARIAVVAELVPINTPLFDRINSLAIVAAHARGLEPVVTYPALYATADDAGSLDVLRAIRDNATMKDKWLSRHFIRDFHMKSSTELVRAVTVVLPRIIEEVPIEATFAPIVGTWEEAVRRTMREGLLNIQPLAYSCTYEFKKHTPRLPKMGVDKDDEWNQLRALCQIGFKNRLLKPVLGYQPTREQLPAYIERLKYELDVLRTMGFSNYFLLVSEIVNWSKENGIIVGPGRGSVGGSLVAYLIGITDVDPIRFDLLFERFINPERIDLPDADLDFMSQRREEVIEYIVERFGQEQVAGISNYTTLQAAGALRDVSRIHGLAPYEYSCSKLMEKEHGVSLSLEESAAIVPEIEKFKVERPVIWDHATRLEGCMRGLGQHAAGVIIADSPVAESAVIETRTKGRVANWDKKYVEEWGLIKIDILGLTTLDMLGHVRTYIKERHGVDIDFLSLPLDDPKVLAKFAGGHTTGIFQFESSGMRKLLADLAMGGPLTFDDLVAVVALFRPGPLDAGLCDEYIQIKQGAREPFYESANMEPALRGTFGVIVYQEQVMQIARDVAGFTMAEADHLRKAMGKKDAEKMKAMKDKFVAGCATVSSMDESRAGLLWDKIEVFAGYAFNKSHSVEYSLISYWTMWAKTYYPAEFFAACMSVQDKEERLAPLVIDAKTAGISVLPPTINVSTTRIEIDAAGNLVAPFQAIKGISDKVGEALVRLRSALGGAFTDPKQLEPEAQKAVAGWTKVKINAAHREALDKVGAFYALTGGLEPLHVDRLKDRLQLMPGFTVEAVKADRSITADRAIQLKLIDVLGKTRTCEGCSLKGGVHVMPRMGKTPKFMAIFDGPTFEEERAGKMLEGKTSDFVKAALKDVGLSPDDGYYTSMVKSPKAGKGYTNEQLNGCFTYVQQEIEILKPPIILLLGTNAFRAFATGLKGGMVDFAGKVIYDPKLDASIVVGINPAQVLFDDRKVTLLQEACRQVAELVKS
jgi:DNA polymerase-3 subunit alpha